MKGPSSRSSSFIYFLPAPTKGLPLQTRSVPVPVPQIGEGDALRVKDNFLVYSNFLPLFFGVTPPIACGGGAGHDNGISVVGSQDPWRPTLQVWFRNMIAVFARGNLPRCAKVVNRTGEPGIMCSRAVDGRINLQGGSRKCRDLGRDKGCEEALEPERNGISANWRAGYQIAISEFFAGWLSLSQRYRLRSPGLSKLMHPI